MLILIQPDGQLRRTSAAPGQALPGQRGGPVEIAERVAARLLAAGEVSAAAMLPEADWLGLVPDTTLRTDVCLAIARTKPERPPVGLAVAQEGVPGDEERQILRQLGLSIALAVEALRSYAEEHHVALTLQRSFLPASLPARPGLAMAVRYIPASDQAEIGGDFYEALSRPDGTVLIAIGDVQGHSLRAATVMGALRHALRAFAAEGHPPVRIVGLVNDVLQRYHPNIIATICLAQVDPDSGELELVNCGHIPPLVVDGQTAEYRGQGGLMLGLPVHDPHSERLHLPAGATLLMITDGLVEDRRTFLDENMEKLRLAAIEVSGFHLEAFTNQLMAMFGLREDDVAMIALHGEPWAEASARPCRRRCHRARPRFDFRLGGQRRVRADGCLRPRGRPGPARHQQRGQDGQRGEADAAPERVPEGSGQRGRAWRHVPAALGGQDHDQDGRPRSASAADLLHDPGGAARGPRPRPGFGRPWNAPAISAMVAAPRPAPRTTSPAHRNQMPGCEPANANGIVPIPASTM